MFEYLPSMPLATATEESPLACPTIQGILKAGGEDAAIILAIALLITALGQFVKALVPLVRSSQQPEDTPEEDIVEEHHTYRRQQRSRK